MYERQAYEDADGRWTFWGGLAVGAVDGGRGLIDQHAAAAERHGDRDPPRLRGRGARARRRDRAPRPTARARPCTPARSCWPRAASSPTRRCAPPTSGPNWDVAKVRGTPYNTGEVLRAALALGAQPYGHWSGCHAIQWDRDAPPTGDLELTNRFSRQSYPVGIVVNADGERFLDEGADFRNYTYAKYGAEVLRPAARRRPPGLRREVAPAPAQRSTTRRRAPRASTRRTLRELAEGLGIDPERFERTVDRLQRRDRPGRRSTPRSRTACARTAWRSRRPTGRWRSTRRRSSPSRSPAGSRSPSAACASTSDARVLDVAGRPIRACSRPASWSAACSSTTTPAAAA